MKGAISLIVTMVMSGWVQPGSVVLSASGCSSTPYSSAARRTFDDVLGKKRIDALVKQVLDEFQRQWRFEEPPRRGLDEQAPQDTAEFPTKKKDEGPRPKTLESQQKVSGEKPPWESPGNQDDLTTKIETGEIRRLSVASNFPTSVSNLIYKVETSLNEKAAEKRLREGFALFLANYTRYAQGRTTGPVILLSEKYLNAYMKESEKCGEIPCNQPPCCKDCDPCK